MSRALIFLVVLLHSPGVADAADPSPSPCRITGVDGYVSAVARTDHQPGGNRVVPGCGPLDGAAVLDIDLFARPLWVLPDPTERGGSWIVTLEDGTVVRVRTPHGGDAIVEPEPLAILEPGEPPIVTTGRDGSPLVGSALVAAEEFADPLPGARIVQAPDGTRVVLSGPTTRYPHGVLGDELEASAVSILRADGSEDRIEVASTEVIEGSSPILADLSGDGLPEIIVTISDTRAGSRLVVYDLQGHRVATSQPIGRGFRWLHQIAAGTVGPDGETEVVVVRTPHIGGIVEAHRLVEGTLELVARAQGYSSHRLGSPNLDMALIAHAGGDARPDVVVPTQDMRSLGILSRVPEGFVVVGSLPLDGVLSTNVASTPDPDGSLVMAAGTEDGRLRIFR